MKTHTITAAFAAIIALVLASCGTTSTGPKRCAEVPGDCTKPSPGKVVATSGCGNACKNDCAPGHCQCCAGGPCQVRHVAVAKKPAPAKIVATATPAPKPLPAARVDVIQAPTPPPAMREREIIRQGIRWDTKIPMPPEEAARLGIDHNLPGVITVREVKREEVPAGQSLRPAGRPDL